MTKKYKLIIAGTRFLTDAKLLDAALAYHHISPSKVDCVVCGEASGPDTLGKKWAGTNGIPVESYPAKWNDLTVKPCVVRYRRDGTAYNAAAGNIRNKLMADNATHLLLIWDGKSNGSADMLKIAKKQNLKVMEYIVKGGEK